MKIYCYDCNKDVEVDLVKEKREYTYHNHIFMVEEDICYCPYCKAELINNLDDDLDHIYNGYLSLFGLSILRFKEIRESLGLSVSMFAKALGWGFKSVYRYESGESIPEGEYLSVYIKLNDNKDYILEKLYQNKENMTEEEYYHILDKLNLNIDVKSRNVILYIINHNPRFVIPIVKNLFAIDCSSMQTRGLPITHFKYVKMPFGPNIDKYVDVLNSMLNSGEIKIYDSIYVDGDLKNQYISNRTYDEKLFTKEELDIMNQVFLKTKDKSAKELSDWSHTFKGWKETNMGQEISLEKYAKYFDMNNL